jgi:hypothetical protein
MTIIDIIIAKLQADKIGYMIQVVLIGVIFTVLILPSYIANYGVESIKKATKSTNQSTLFWLTPEKVPLNQDFSLLEQYDYTKIQNSGLPVIKSKEIILKRGTDFSGYSIDYKDKAIATGFVFIPDSDFKKWQTKTLDSQSTNIPILVPGGQIVSEKIQNSSNNDLGGYKLFTQIRKTIIQVQEGMRLNVVDRANPADQFKVLSQVELAVDFAFAGQIEGQSTILPLSYFDQVEKLLPEHKIIDRYYIVSEDTRATSDMLQEKEIAFNTLRNAKDTIFKVNDLSAISNSTKSIYVGNMFFIVGALRNVGYFLICILLFLLFKFLQNEKKSIIAFMTVGVRASQIFWLYVRMMASQVFFGMLVCGLLSAVILTSGFGLIRDYVLYQDSQYFTNTNYIKDVSNMFSLRYLDMPTTIFTFIIIFAFYFVMLYKYIYSSKLSQYANQN